MAGVVQTGGQATDLPDALRLACVQSVGDRLATLLMVSARTQRDSVLRAIVVLNILDYLARRMRGSVAACVSKLLR